MSRAVGHRDKPELYGLILAQLRKHPEGRNARQIHQEVKDYNYMTVRLYLSDLVEQKKIVGMAVTKTIIRYTLAGHTKRGE